MPERATRTQEAPHPPAIADAAARLFAERGYERVTVADVAREAEVSEQTVYNYFPGKEQLVTDLDQQVQERLCELIRDGRQGRRRPPRSGTSRSSSSRASARSTRHWRGRARLPGRDQPHSPPPVAGDVGPAGDARSPT